MWHKAGGLWVQQQLRKEEQKTQQDGLEPTTTVNLTELLPSPPAVDPPDWPWRPRDLEALLSRFNLLVDSSRDGHVFGRGGFGPSTHGTAASVLSYDGFLTFWDESGIKELLGEVRGCLLCVVWCGVVWCGVVWCGVVWCGVVWCGVVWCLVCCGVLCVLAAVCTATL
jgi:hypothetical protein